MSGADTTHWNGNRAVAAFTFDLDADEIWRVLAEDDSDWAKPAIKTRGEFGPKIAVPRILRLFDRYDQKCTFHIPGKVAENWPETVKRIHDAGHEIAHHGYTHVGPREMSKEQEEQEFLKTLDIFDDLIDETPVGYRNPGGGMSEYTLELLEEHGFIYDSSRKDLDVPYFHPESEDCVVEIPNSYYLDDFVYFGYNMGPTFDFQAGITPTGPVFDSWKEELEGIYQEKSIFMLTMHPQVIGRAGRMRALEELLQNAVEKNDMWVTTSENIAQDWRDNN
jgi:peptidoglycan/xylan/chitin deacetylase (PgdA/CDA1 family)